MVGKTLHLMGHKIPAADRDPFLARFSRLHAGALVTLRVDAGTEVKDQPFHGISADGLDLVVHTGDGGGKPHLDHRVAHVTSVTVEQAGEERDAAIAMISKDGTQTEIRFRSPMRADLLDPAVE